MSSTQLAVLWIHPYKKIKYFRDMVGSGFYKCNFCESEELTEKWIFHFNPSRKGFRFVCASCSILKKGEYMDEWLAIHPEKRMGWKHG
jgi:hypothetical protein